MASAIVGALKVLLQADTAAFEAKLKTADANTKRLADRLKNDLTPSQKAVNSAVREFLGTKEIGNAERYAKAIQEIGGANKLTAADQAKVNRAVSEAVNHYRALGQQAPAHLVKLQQETRQAAIETGKLGSAMTTMRGVLGAFGVTLGAAGIVSFGRHIFDTADKLVDMSDKLGVSIEATQRFQYAAKQAGADIDQIGKAIVGMNDRLATGDKSTVAALEMAGLKFADIRMMKPEGAFRAIADAIAEIPDPMRQTQVAMDLFGKSGAELLPMIRSGALEAADAIDVMADGTVRELEAAKQTWENFGNSVTIKSAEILTTLPKIVDLWKALGRAFADSPFSTIGTILKGGGGLQTGNVSLGLVRAGIEAMVNEKLTERRDIALPLEIPPPPAGETDDQRRAREAEQKRRQELIRTWTGANIDEDVRRMAAAVQQLGGTSRFTDEQLEKFIDHLDELHMSGRALPPVLDQIRMSAKRMLQIGPLPKEFAAVAALMASGPDSPMFVQWGKSLLGFSMPQVDDSPMFVQWGKDFLGGWRPNFGGPSSGFGASMSGVLSMLPQSILGALQGGGGIGRTIGGLFGGGLLGDLGKTVSGKLAGTFLGKGLGSAIGSVIPGIGTIVGGLFGNLFGGLFGPSKVQKEGREATAKIEDLQKKLVGPAGLFGTFKDLEAAAQSFGMTFADIWDRKGVDGLKLYEDRLAQFEKRQKQVAERTAQLSSVMQAFGGIAPKALDPLINSLLGMNLPPELRAMLQASQKPNWQMALSTAQELGIDESALGRNFYQQKIAEQGFELIHKFEMFERFGSDMNGVLRGMADEFSNLADESVRSGVALPKRLEDVFRRLSSQGLLVDKDGNAIALEALMFQEMQDEKLNEAVRLLEEIRDILAGRDPNAPKLPGGRLPGVDLPNPGDDLFKPPVIEPRLPGFRGGTHGAYMDFGPGTPVMLHGRERVMTETEGAFASGAPQMMTVIWQADGREMSRMVMPYVAGEVKRLGLIR